MTSQISALLETTPVVPLIQTDGPAIAVKIAHALAEGNFEAVTKLARETPNIAHTARAK